MFNNAAYYRKATVRWMVIFILWHFLNQLKISSQRLFLSSWFSFFFCQDIGTEVGSDLAPFFSNLYLFCCKSEWLSKIKHIDHYRARGFGHVYRFIDDPIAINNCETFENYFKETYPKKISVK